MSLKSRLELVIKEISNGNQASFARKLGKTRAAVNKYVNGSSNLSDATYKQIEQLGVNIAWLKTGEGEPFNKKTHKIVPPGADSIEWQTRTEKSLGYRVAPSMICPTCDFGIYVEDHPKAKHCPLDGSHLIKTCPNCSEPILYPLTKYCAQCGQMIRTRVQKGG